MIADSKVAVAVSLWLLAVDVVAAAVVVVVVEDYIGAGIETKLVVAVAGVEQVVHTAAVAVVANEHS